MLLRANQYRSRDFSRVALAAASLISLTAIANKGQPVAKLALKPKTERSIEDELKLTNKISSLVMYKVVLTTTTTTSLPEQLPVTTTTTSEVTPPSSTITGQPSGILRAIGGCESGGSANAAINYQAQNPTSSASGGFQILDSTWAGFDGYAAAKLAPPAVQIEQAEQLYESKGTAPWAASESCWDKV